MMRVYHIINSSIIKIWPILKCLMLPTVHDEVSKSLGAYIESDKIL